MATYRIETLTGRGLPTTVDADGHDTYLAAREMADDCHDGEYRIVEESESYEVRYGNGRTTSHDSYEAAVAELRAAGCQEIGHDGDLSDFGDHTLAWMTAEDAEDDDGAHAHASIVRR